MTPIERKARELLAAHLTDMRAAASIGRPITVAEIDELEGALAALTPPASGLPELPEHVAWLVANGPLGPYAMRKTDPRGWGYSEKLFTAQQLHAYALEAIAASMVWWLPIESAPKDGTKILIWRDGWDYAPVAWRDAIDGEDGSFGAWVFDDSLCLGVSDGVLGWNEDVEDGSMPTHWMPIPAAPSPKRDEP